MRLAKKLSQNMSELLQHAHSDWPFVVENLNETCSILTEGGLVASSFVVSY